MLKSIERRGHPGMTIGLLTQRDLLQIRGGVAMPPLLPILGAGLGLYVGLCGLAYYTGYGAHAVYDYLKDSN
jgi:hypothetical protein